MPLDEEIRERVASYGFGPQLDALPSAESMTWVPHSAGNPAFGLTIARSEGRQILAYLTRYGEKPLEVRYCTRTFDKPGHKSPTLITTITQDEVMKVPLEAPFKYLAENTKPMKRKFSMLIRWYFLSHGLIDSLEGDMDDFSKRFGAAVRRIEDAKHDEQEGTQHRTRRHRETIEESPEPEDEENAYGLRSGGRTRSSNLLNSEKESPLNTLPQSPPVLRSAKENTDLRRLREYLDYHDTLYLLENIPEADEMQFVDQTSYSDAQPKKLFIGSEAKSGDDIYAYMVSLPRGFHEVRFYVQHTQRDGHMKTETVTKQRLVHPFSKCFPKPPTSVEQSDRARLTLMVKYYFIAAGIVTDCILHETKKFPERLRVALDYIAERMGPAAVKPPSNDTTTEDTTLPSELLPAKRLSSESSYVDESDIQSTLAGEPTPRPATRHKSSLSACSTSTSTTRKPTISSTVLPSSLEPTPLIDSNSNPSFPPITSVPHHSHSNSHSTNDASLKRSAEDAEFEDLARIIMKEQNLTKEINSLQHDLDVLEERKRMWLEKWDKEFEALSSRKDGIVEERTKVRKVFKRQRLSSQGEDE